MISDFLACVVAIQEIVVRREEFIPYRYLVKYLKVGWCVSRGQLYSQFDAI